MNENQSQLKPQKTTHKPSGSQYKLKDIIEMAKTALSDVTGFPVASVAGIKKEDEEWLVTIELLEKEGIPDRMDILGEYEVRMDTAGDMVRYERKGLRKRGDTGQVEVEE
jgi:hypothetical protein